MKTSPTSTAFEPGCFVATRHAVSRRHFLRGAGVMLALPLLGSMLPAFARAAAGGPPINPAARPRRFIGICNNLSVLPEHFFPTETGRGYALSLYLQQLAEHREEFTVFSGVSHPDVDGGHPADVCFLSAAPHPASSGFRNTISLDQYMAEHLGHLTRFPSLTLGVNSRPAIGISITRSGAQIPAENKASAVFRRMFVQGTPEEVAAQKRRLQRGQSILDAVAGQAKDLQRSVTARDRDRLDQYFTSVRDLEERLRMTREWEDTPRPVVSVTEPIDPPSPKEYMAKAKLMYDMARLAFETDSTRSISLMLDSMGSPAIEFGETKFTDGYHSLSHHGKSPAKLKLLEAADMEHMRLLNEFLTGLKQVSEEDESVLDRTMVVYGSNMNSADTHSTINLPIILAGGGFHHGQHLVFDREHNYPLPNLFVSMLQRQGIETDRFATATGPMRGLEMA
jgi:BMFP domain-containing protein YqiC